MNKLNLSGMFQNIKTGVGQRSPEILTGIGISCGITTTILAVKATPKALRLINEQKEEKAEELGMYPYEVDLSALEVVKATWMCYIPAAVSGAVSISCLIGASSVNARRNAALATAYKLSETALLDYREKVIETLGEKKERGVRDKVAKKKVDDNPVTKKEVIITGKGETLCYDAQGGRYFKSDIDKIRKSENILNKRLIDEMYISLNDFYYELGLEGTKIGNDLGWKLDDGLIEIEFSSQLADDTPCVVLDYSIAPKYGYSKLV